MVASYSIKIHCIPQNYWSAAAASICGCVTQFQGLNFLIWYIAMAQQSQSHQQETTVKFKTIKLYKEQVLGSGSYGTVYRAKCDDLPCAAKILHPTLFIPSQHFQISPKHVHRQPVKRFEAECEFLYTIRHPNIVQYLGMHQDPDNNLPVLLMELTDDNLTHYLENTSEAVPYHIQVMPWYFSSTLVSPLQQHHPQRSLWQQYIVDRQCQG